MASKTAKAPKSFRGAADRLFITPEGDVKRAEDAEGASRREEVESLEIPKGYTLVKERKSKRIQVLIRPTTHLILVKAAAMMGKSVNGLINDILEDWIDQI